MSFAISTNVSSITAQNALKKNSRDMQASLRRLSTGLKINGGADNPAGLIASENLRMEKSGIEAGLRNAERASTMIATAEGGLSEVSNLLNELQGLVNETANTGGLSAEEIDANQLQVDSILNTINRLAQSVNFQGKKLLNGNYDYTTSGANLSSFTDVQIDSARLVDGKAKTVVADITAVASQGLVEVNVSGGFAAAYTIEVAGTKGTEQLSFLSGASAADIVAAVNAVTGVTGVEATTSGNDIDFQSEKFGSDEFVSIKTISGTFANGNDSGADATVTINGAAAEVDGLDVTYRSSGLDVSFSIIEAANTAATKTFSITKGGAQFSLGSSVNETEKASLGIASVSTGSLGIAGSYLSTLGTGGSNSLSSTSLNKAQEIIEGAVKQVSETRGRLGAFQKFVVNSTVNQLGVAYENASAAESAIRDTDFAVETAALTRAQIMAQASTSVLAQANQQPQLALQLLG